MRKFYSLFRSRVRLRRPASIVSWGGRLLAVGLLAGAVPAAAQSVAISGPTGSAAFGGSITVLPNGNYVVTDPGYGNGSGINVGAVYLYNGSTNALISTLTGSSALNQVGNGGITVLANGNYVVRSPTWDNGAVPDVGAATWCSGTTGLNGVVSAANSLVGSSARDLLGGIVTALANGNYVVPDPSWDNGAVPDVGAVAWCNGTAGASGVLDPTTCLLGSSAYDQVGNAVTVLGNGNYVVSSPGWDNGTVVDAGAVTWCSGTAATSGVVDPTNSLVGSSASDNVGSNGTITVLANDNYVVRNNFWDNGTAVNAGAVTWGSGTGITSGPVSAANSLVGTVTNDNVGGIITPLTNGSYVVISFGWDNGTVANAGAVTWCSGTAATSGPVSTTNSLVGTATDDNLGIGGVTALANGHYVVRIPTWDNGAVANVGAVTWGSGTAGVSGVVDPTNSLVGATAGDQVGSFVTALANGHYVVSSPNWDNGTMVDAGAATWCNGTTGASGLVSAATSLTGASASDNVAGSGATALANGHYVVRSPNWDNGAVANVGAVTWANGTTGANGVVSAANSLTGSTASDLVGGSSSSGGVAALANGHYVVSSPGWDNGAVANVGAVTWANGTATTSGVVAPDNSLTGTKTNDNVGGGGGGMTAGGVTALPDGNYLVRSSVWDNGPTANVGALSLGSGTGGTVGMVTACNSIVGNTPSNAAGTLLQYAYNAATGTLLGGLPRENKVVVGVNAPPAPTGGARQSYSSGRTLADLTALGTAVQWYAAANSGTPLPAATPLADGTTYYATQTVGGCESLSRLAVTTVAGPLPVELKQFTAVPEGTASVRVAWATALEKNSHAFEVERSLNGTSFARIGTVAAAGSSSAPRRYELLDAQLPIHQSTLYYRLKQVDADGTFAYSPVRTVALAGAAGLSLYPNPTHGAATLTGAQPGAVVTVTDALGRPVTSATTDAAGTATLALPAGQPAGVYVVRAGTRAVKLTVE